jgi:energy-coupling factor transporter ATP-binding protein EcfA2
MIEARGLVKRYGAAAAVNDLSFTIRPGLVTGFLGPNGAGKTTTMRLILGLDYPSAGTAVVNGKPYAQLPDPMHEVGALLDAGAVHGGRTACHHLLGLAPTNGIGRRRVDEVPACWARWRRRRVEARIGSLTPTIVPLSLRGRTSVSAVPSRSRRPAPARPLRRLTAQCRVLPRRRGPARDASRNHVPTAGDRRHARRPHRTGG